MGAMTYATSTYVDLQLTEEEKKFINEHPVIDLGIDPEFIPFEFIDNDGQYKGIAADYIELLSKKIGIEMNIKKDLTWSEVYEAAAQKQLDVLPCISITKERQNYFLFSDPYYYFQRVIIVKNTNLDIKDIKSLEQAAVAVQRNSSHHSYLNTLSNMHLNLYHSVEEALLAVANGSEIAFVGNLATSSYLIKSIGLTDLKYIKLEEQEKQSLHLAIRNDWPELVSIINKGLASITEEEKMEINNRWITLESDMDYGPIIRIILIVSLIILIIFIVSIYWIIRLKKEVIKRMQIEQDLVRAKQEAEAANQIKSIFLARMSHEIRTPLNAITGMSYLIKKTDLTITQKMYLEKITQASGNMLNIINDILDFSKIESGKVEIEKISFNLDHIIQSVINIISYKIEEQGIGLSLTKEPNLPNHFFGDPKRIEQILLNVINNAVKFTSKGEVLLGIRLIACEGNLYHLEFRVQDTGIGMSSEQLSELFEPFAQGDSSINRRFGGTGLGLSIVKNLVEMMQGEINVYSTLGQGSTFIIKLSFEADTDKELEEKQKATGICFQNIKAIIFDKIGANLNLIESYLNSFGIDAELSTSQKYIMERLEASNEKYTKPYDLLILDWEAPLEGGFEFVEKMRSNIRIVKKPKVIMMMPLMRQDLFEKNEHYSIDFVIAKPIIPSLLYNGILEIFKAKVLVAHQCDTQLQPIEDISQKLNYHILVVEDNQTNQLIARSLLERVGLVVYLANNGQEGVACFKKYSEELDLILMDLHMPIMNGYDAAKEIRKLDEHIPIVAMTADAVTGVEKKCKQHGINEYISKPFDPDQFVDGLIRIIKNVAKEELISDTPVLDQTQALRYLGNNLKLYQQVLEAYYKENKDLVKHLNLAIGQKRYLDAIQIVHKNKSSSGSIGAKALVTTAVALQKALTNGSQDEIEQHSIVFIDLINQVLKEIKELLLDKNIFF